MSTIKNLTRDRRILGDLDKAFPERQKQVEAMNSAVLAPVWRPQLTRQAINQMHHRGMVSDHWRAAALEVLGALPNAPPKQA